MKTTKTISQAADQELDVMSKADLVLVKTSIALFTIVLNICFFELFY
jgi:hypothetical protein